MTDLPYMRWFPDTILADTSWLTLEESGAYRILLDNMWINGTWLPDDDKKIARLLRVSPRKWQTIKSNIAHLFFYKDGQFTQKRLAAEIIEARRKLEVWRNNGQKGGLKRAENLKTTQANALADGKAIANPNAQATNTNPTTNSTNKSSSSTSSANDFKDQPEGYIKSSLFDK